MKHSHAFTEANDLASYAADILARPSLYTPEHVSAAQWYEDTDGDDCADLIWLYGEEDREEAWRKRAFAYEIRTGREYPGDRV